MIWIIYKLGCSIESLINIYSNILECALSYGENCQYPCSVHCINKVCDRFNGTCLFGCAEGKNCDRGMCISFLNFITVLCIWAFVLLASSMHKP